MRFAPVCPSQSVPPHSPPYPLKAGEFNVIKIRKNYLPMKKCNGIDVAISIFIKPIEAKEWTVIKFI